jgi:hypothetical protein
MLIIFNKKRIYVDNNQHFLKKKAPILNPFNRVCCPRHKSSMPAPGPAHLATHPLPRLYPFLCPLFFGLNDGFGHFGGGVGDREVSSMEKKGLFDPKIILAEDAIITLMKGYL